MTYLGTVHNGVIVLASGQTLPDGTAVVIAPQTPAAQGDDGQTLGQKLVALADWAETQPCDLPEDLALNHDHYLHGVAKRQ